MYSDNQEIRNVQEKLLSLMVALDQFCRKNKVQYSVHGGTMLGAVREGGFIPWDDDMDITMTRREYEKFVSCLQKEGQEARIQVLCGTAHFSIPEISQSLWIDLFVYDSVTAWKFLQKVRLGILLLVECMCRTPEEMEMIRGNIHRKWQVLFFRGANACGRVIPHRVRMTLFAKTCQSVLKGNGSWIHRSTDQLKGMKTAIPASWMTEFEDIPFEDTTLMISKHYHEILVSCYGENYMTPAKDQDTLDSHAMIREFLEEKK